MAKPIRTNELCYLTHLWDKYLKNSGAFLMLSKNTLCKFHSTDLEILGGSSVHEKMGCLILCCSQQKCPPGKLSQALGP
jgi:hypothetical protein